MGLVAGVKIKHLLYYNGRGPPGFVKGGAPFYAEALDAVIENRTAV